MWEYDYRSYFNTLISKCNDIIENQETIISQMTMYKDILYVIMGITLSILAFSLIKQWRFKNDKHN